MKIVIERTNQKIECRFQGKVKHLIEKLGLNPETVLVTRKKQLLTEEDAVKNTDELCIFSVISGG